MSVATSKLILRIVIMIWLLSLGRSLLIMVGGNKLFKKASKGEKTAFYPILNLFTMLEIVDVSTFFGILFFIPVINLVALILMSYKLGVVFNCSTGNKIGLILLPIVFYPMLCFSNKQYKVSDEEYFKALDNARGEKISLMTNEEATPQALPSNEEEAKTAIDSIFKSEFDTIEQPEKYKASKIDILADNPTKIDVNKPTYVEEVYNPIVEDNKPSMSIEDLLKTENEIQEAKQAEKQDENIEILDL